MLKLATNIGRFRPKNRRQRRLPFPATPSQRIAQISAVTHPFDLAQLFPCDRWNELQTFRPRVLVGSLSDLRRLSSLAETGEFSLSSVDHALFVLTICGLAPLTDVDRVSLWQAFGVPLFELFLDSHGRLLAAECEAHDGWHIETGSVFTLLDGKLVVDMPMRKGIETGLSGELDATICPCGREGLRVMNVCAQTAWPTPRAMAATA